MDSTLKKRNRIPSSCSICRKRKSKCDRVKPVCGSCKKKSIAHLCFYETDKPNDKVGEGMKSSNGIPVDVYANPPSSNSLGSNIPSPLSSSNPVLQTPGYYYPPSEHHSGEHMEPPPGFTPVPPHLSAGNPYPYQQMVPPGPHPHVPVMPQINQHILAMGSNIYTDTDHAYRHTQRQNVGLVSNHSSSGSPGNRHQTPLLPPIKSADLGDVVVSIGPNLTLKINSNDEIDTFFTNASYPLLLEGPYLQHHGPLTYIGIAKSDRFVKFFRKFAIDLLKKGEMSEFVLKKKRKKASNGNSPNNVKKSKSQNSTPMNSNATSANSQGIQGTPDSTGMQVDSKAESTSENDHHKSTNGIPTTSSISSSTVHSVKGLAISRSDIFSNDLMTTAKAANGQNSSVGAHSDHDDDGEDDEDDDDDDVSDKDVDDEDDVLVITKINVAKAKKRSGGEPENSSPLNIMPGLKALYLGQSPRKEYYKIVEQAALQIFPSKRNALTLFSRFFKWVEPFIPVLSEKVMITDFNDVVDTFPSFENSRYQAITIKSDKHLTILGMMLIILRLGYMSYIHNSPENNEFNDVDKQIMEECKAVPPKVFEDVINLCIPDEHTSLRSTFRMVQLLCLLYFYRQVAPHDCHGLGAADSQILFGTIVRHALSIGLNRDPSKFKEHETISSNVALVETWRLLWNFILLTDANISMHRSAVLNIYSTDVSDIDFYDSTRDEIYIQTRIAILKINSCYRNVCKIFSNFKEKPKIIDLLAETNKMEHLFLKLFGKDFFKDEICKPASQRTFTVGSREHYESFLKVWKYMTFVSVRTNLSTIYYVIAMNYEKKYNEDKSTSLSSGVELFKIHFKSVVQLVYIMSYVFDNSVQIFGKNYDHIITACNERYMIKTHSFLTSFFIRLIHQKQLLTFRSFEPRTAERLLAINRLFNTVLTDAELFVGSFRKLSSRYSNSYKIYVLTYYVLKQCIDNAEVFFKYALSDISMILETTNMLQYFSADELNYLCKLCEDFRSAKNAQEKQRKANTLFESSNKREPTKDNFQEAQDKEQGNDMFAFFSSRPNPLKELGSLFKMPGDESGSMSPESNGLNPLPNFHDSNFKSDDFMKLFELYGDPSNPHLE